MEYTFSVQLWIWEGSAAWHFVTLPESISKEIKQLSGPVRKRFGSVRVQASIGDSTWSTLLFPDSKTNCYLLPLKKQVRSSEELQVANVVQVSIKIIEL
jgi:hypothetical protein